MARSRVRSRTQLLARSWIGWPLGAERNRGGIRMRLPYTVHQWSAHRVVLDCVLCVDRRLSPRWLFGNRRLSFAYVGVVYVLVKVLDIILCKNPLLVSPTMEKGKTGKQKLSESAKKRSNRVSDQQYRTRIKLLRGTMKLPVSLMQRWRTKAMELRMSNTEFAEMLLDIHEKWVCPKLCRYC